MNGRVIMAATLAAFALSLASCCCGSDCGGGCPSGCTCEPDLVATFESDMRRASCVCGSPGPASDAGPLPDTGPRPDTGPPPDTGPLPDTGPPPGTCPVDAGVSFDASLEAGSFSVDASDDAVSDASSDAALRPIPGAYPIVFAPEPPDGTALVLGDDELSSPIPIGFPFRFFDATHTELVVSSNGFITFATTSMSAGCCAGHTIPMPDEVNDVIAYGWTDLLPPSGGSLTHDLRGVAPHRRFVVTATDQQWYRNDGGVPRVTAQVILYEGTDFIEIHTALLSPGHVYTQGTENASGCGALFLPGRVAADFSLASDGVRFVTY